MDFLDRFKSVVRQFLWSLVAGTKKTTSKLQNNKKNFFLLFDFC